MPAPLSEERIARTLRALKDNDYLAYFVPHATEAAALIADAVEPHARVGLGGSQTVRSMGLMDLLRGKGAFVIDHWDESLSPEEGLQARKDQLLCDVFVSSVNAVTESGELVSRDAVGNRIAATAFGPGRVFLVAGTQKIVPDLHAAFRRIRDVAAPMRARSLGLDLPCAEERGCVDCNASGRICRATLVLHKRPLLTDVTVILVGEPIGY